jgi:phenylpropionate dioxygenase-like ring-hydroxylating dioxygenase large terminal subunit
MTTPSLANYWHPIGTSDDVGEQPKQFTLLGEKLVAFRDRAGVAVFKDLCIHRGTALSLGEINDGRLTCAYHGWQYDRSGACVQIPALPPGSAIPRKARAIVYRAEDRHGLVWVAMAEPVSEVPPWPDVVSDNADFEIFLAGRALVRTSAGRAIENAMDFSHFNFVHKGYTELADGPIIKDHHIKATDFGLQYEYDDSLIIRRYQLHTPFTLHDIKIQRNGDTSVLTFIASPVEENLTDVYRFTARNHRGATGLKGKGEVRDREAIIESSNFVFEQDRKILESQRPELIPTDLKDELHLKIPDASGIAYRRLLAGIALSGPFMP